MSELHNLDLNLLVALDVFLEERNVTKAASRLGRSQPAASAMLRRLRDLFNDELLIRGRSEMFLTARAQSLRFPLRDALQALTTAVHSGETFDPLAFEGEFRFAVSDLASFLLGPKLSIIVNRAMPNALLSLVPLDRNRLRENLTDGSVDAAVIATDIGTGPFHTRPLLEDELVFVAAPGHPLENATSIPLRKLAAFPRLTVSVADLILGDFHRGMQKIGLDWKPSISVGHFGPVPGILRNGQFVSYMGRQLAHSLSDLGTLVILDSAETLPKIQYRLVWHRRGDHEPAQCWIRDAIARAAQPDRA